MDGTINTIAGNGTPTFAGDNGMATTAQIDPSAVAVDGQGNLYIADGFNFRIRKVDTNGIITTIAGDGLEGYSGDNGPAVIAKIDYVTGLAVDNDGNIYLADLYNYEVRENRCTWHDDGLRRGQSIRHLCRRHTRQHGCDASLWRGVRPFRQFVHFRRVQPADHPGGPIHGIDLYRRGGWYVGFSGDGGAALAAEIGFPGGLAISSGVVYFADETNQRVRKVANYIISTVAGTGIRDHGAATNAFLNFPEGIAIDGSGDILVADTGNAEARQFKAGGNIASVGQLQGGTPSGVAVDQAGNFFVTAEVPSFPNELPQLLKIGSDGSTTVVAGNGPDGFSGDDGPATLAVLNAPQGVVVDGAGNIYIADYGNHRVRKIDTSGNINTIAGNGQSQFSGDNGPAIVSRNRSLRSGAGQRGGHSGGGSAKQSHSPDRTEQHDHHGGGNGRPGYAGDGGPAAEALLRYPTGIALDRSGNMYIADEGNSVVRRVTKGGLITTIAGNGTFDARHG